MVESRLKKLFECPGKRAFLFYYPIHFFFPQDIPGYVGSGFCRSYGDIAKFIGLLNLAELGIGASIGFVLYKPLFNGDKDKIRDIISVLGYLYRNVGLIILGWGLY